MTDKVSLIVEIDASAAQRGAVEAEVALRKLTKSADEFARAEAAVAAGSRKAADVLNAKTAADMRAKVAQNEATQAIIKNNQALKDQAARLKETHAEQDRMIGKLKGLAGGLLGIVGVSATVAGAFMAIKNSTLAFIAASDKMAGFRGQMKMVSDSVEGANDALSRGLAVSNASGAALDSTLNLYGRMARASDELGLNQDELWQITDTVNKSFIVSGATAQEAAAATLQLSQGMASGVLRGEELNSVMENSPRLAKAMADGLGVSRGELRAMGKEGELTAKAVAGALLKMSSDIEEEFKQMPVTVARTMNEVRNAFNIAISGADTSEVSAELKELAGVFTDPEFLTGMESLGNALMNIASWAVQAGTAIAKLAADLSNMPSEIIEALAMGFGGAGPAPETMTELISDYTDLNKELERQTALLSHPAYKDNPAEIRNIQVETARLTGDMVTLQNQLALTGQRLIDVGDGFKIVSIDAGNAGEAIHQFDVYLDNVLGKSETSITGIYKLGHAFNMVANSLVEMSKKQQESLDEMTAENKLAPMRLIDPREFQIQTLLLKDGITEASVGYKEFRAQAEQKVDFANQGKDMRDALTQNNDSLQESIDLAKLSGVALLQETEVIKARKAALAANKPYDEAAEAATRKQAAELYNLQNAYKDMSSVYEKTIKQLDQEAALRGMNAKEAFVETEMLQLQKQAIAEKQPMDEKQLETLRALISAEWDRTHSQEELLTQSEQMALSINKEIALIGMDARAVEMYNTVQAFNTMLREKNRKAMDGELDSLLELVDRKYDLIEREEAQQAALKTSGENFSVWAETVKGAIQRVDAAFADMWKSAFDGFDEFSKSLKASFEQLLAELAHAAITQPIVLSLGAAITGTASTGASASGAGASVVQSLPGFSALADIGSTLNTLYSGLANTFNSLATSYTTVGGWGAELYNGGGALSSFGGTIAEGANYQASAYGAGGWSAAGMAAANVGGALVGSYAGQKVFDNEASTGIGAAGGGIVGGIVGAGLTYGSPWGAAAGAAVGSFIGEGLEKALGDVFGYSGKNRDRASGTFDTMTGEFTPSSGNHDSGNLAIAEDIFGAIDEMADIMGGQFSAWMRVSNDEGIEIDGLGQFNSSASALDAVYKQLLVNSDSLSQSMKDVLWVFDGTTTQGLELAAAMQEIFGKGKDLTGTVVNLISSFEGTNEELINLLSVIGPDGELSADMKTLIDTFSGTAEELTFLIAAFGPTADLSDAMMKLITTFDAAKDTIDGLLASLDELANFEFELDVTRALASSNAIVDAILEVWTNSTAAGGALMVAYSEQLTSITSLIRDLDGSAASMTTLNEALLINQQYAYDLTLAMIALAETVKATVAATAEGYREEGRTLEENVVVDLDRMKELETLMNSTFDPTLLEAYANEWLALQREVFDATVPSVAPDELKAFTEMFAVDAERIGDLLTGRLGEGVLELYSSQAALNNTLNDLIKAQADALGNSAAVIAAAVASQAAAIDKFVAAVNTFTAKAGVTVGMQFPSTSEVSV